MIKSIDGALIPTHGAPVRSGLRLFALCGFGGLGKTQVAVQYAFTREEDFDAIFWVEAEERTKLDKSFDHIARKLGLIEPTARADSAKTRRAVLEWLEQPLKQTRPSDQNQQTLAKWLVIFDNADNLENLDGYLPLTGCGSILITSRNPLAISELASNQGQTLHPMTTEECSILLAKLVKQELTSQNEPIAALLADKIHRVPLAVRQLAAQIRQNQMTLSESLQFYGEGPLLTELKKVENFPLQDQYRLTLSTVWGFENYTRSELSLLNKLAFMDADQITEDILQQDLSDDIDQDFPRGKSYIEARTSLLSSSMVERDRKDGFLIVHRLVQEIVREKMPPDAIIDNYFSVAKLLVKAWKFKSDKFDREDQANLHHLVRHIIHLHGLDIKYASEWEITDLGKARILCSLFQECAWYSPSYPSPCSSVDVNNADAIWQVFDANRAAPKR